MATVIESDEKLKEIFKSAIVEDIAFSKAIAEGEQTPRVSRESVFEALENVNLRSNLTKASSKISRP